ncbi:MAG TPA: TIGR00266 family protein, partial [Thiotrichales bacterium]|nr:TIGR00266 family protein [Thiotrichales bacterium]
YLELGDKALIVQDTSYLAHYGDVDISIAWRGLRGVLAEGELFWLKLKGRGGVWLNSYGSIDKIELKPGERIIVDNFHFVALTEGTKWKIRKFGGWKSFLLGGEGLVVEVEGPGTILIQSRVLPQLVRLVRKYFKK